MAAIVNSDGNGGRKVDSQSVSQEKAKAEAAAVISQLRHTPAVRWTVQIKIFSSGLLWLVLPNFSSFYKMKTFLIYSLCTLHLARSVSQLLEFNEHWLAVRFAEQIFLLPSLFAKV